MAHDSCQAQVPKIRNGLGIGCYCPFCLIKKDQKIKALFKSNDFACHFRRVRTQTRPSCVGAQTWVLSTASNGAKSGFE
jgi:hypothetical protein